MSNFANRRVGVLALQGDYECHLRQLTQLGVEGRDVRLSGQLDYVDSLIIPGGESTTMDILMDRFGLRQPLSAFAARHPVYGTCAGMILMSHLIEDNTSGVKPLHLMDIDVYRNGYGRQVFSFEAAVKLGPEVDNREVTATFIRAPRVSRVGPDVQVLGTYGDDPVLLRQNNLLASAFHNELDDDTAVLEYFLGSFPTE